MSTERMRILMSSRMSRQLRQERYDMPTFYLGITAGFAITAAIGNNYGAYPLLVPITGYIASQAYSSYQRPSLQTLRDASDEDREALESKQEMPGYAKSFFMGLLIGIGTSNLIYQSTHPEEAPAPEASSAASPKPF